MWQWTDTNRSGAEQQTGYAQVNGYAQGAWSCRETTRTRFGLDEHRLRQL